MRIHVLDPLPRGLPGRLQLAAAAALVLLAFVGSAAVRVSAAIADVDAPAGAVTTATTTPTAPAPDVPADPQAFTVGDVAAGRVPQDVQDRFWQAELDAILAAPCPEATAGGTSVLLFVGADEAWTARLTDATAAHAAACAG